jgi:molybdate transport system substrate-binding protein
LTEGLVIEKNQMPTFFQAGRYRLSLLLVFCVASQGSGRQSKIRVAAASDLQVVMPELIHAYEKQSGTSVEAVFGSSGNLYAQIRNGAPFDLFFSADGDYPRKLAEAGLAEPGSVGTYGFGRIALWMPANAECNLERDGWKCLQNASVKKIAIANPEHAPYGRVAVAALEKAGIYGQLKQKLVYGENISQAAQFVQSGNAQAGILAYSLTISDGMSAGKRWEVPSALYPAIEQSAVVLKSAKSKSAAEDFVKFVTRGPGRDLLAKYGLQPPTVR